ncbi:MAG: putative CRISPR-associated protein [Bacteroidia bacterium]
MRIILSPVGTSILTNLAGDQRLLLNKYANASESQTPPDVRLLIQNLSDQVQNRLSQAQPDALRKASAELNGILGLYKGNLPVTSVDTHWLIATDTYQGQAAARIAQGFLQQYFPDTQTFTPAGLSTHDKAAFMSGIKELLQWCDETLLGYRISGYEIIFNLTGGFKSLQGYLNTIGMFYADEISYIFESGDELITIPRMPIRLETEIFEKNAPLFLQLSQAEDGLPSDTLSAIPDVMLDRFDNRCLLSTWGQLVWNNTKEKILSARLTTLPMIAYEESFRRDFQDNTQAREKVKLQETVAKISCLLQENDGDISCLKGGRGGGILYDNFSGKNSHLGHFRLDQGRRVSAEYIHHTLRLRHFGPHNYVNDNP